MISVLIAFTIHFMLSSDEVVVRDGNLADAQEVCAIYNSAIAERSSTFETRARRSVEFDNRFGSDRFPFLVAVAEERVVGWAGLSPYSSRSCYAGIAEASIYVAPRVRGLGVGTLLAEALANQAEANGFHKLLGKLFTDNIASLALVKRCGFSPIGTHRRHGQLNGEWRDVLLVERLLGTATR